VSGRLYKHGHGIGGTRPPTRGCRTDGASLCCAAPLTSARAPNKTAGETGVVAGGTQHRRRREGVVVGDARPHGGEVTAASHLRLV
jgi:hypothetical protein